MNHISRMASSRASARPITSRPTSSARPITSTGLIAPKSSRGKTGLKRQIQDKTYFIGLLRSKINQLNAEITKLTKECENLADRESRTTIYKRKAEELAKELAVLNRELGVYKEFNERLRTNQAENEIKEDIKELKLENNKQNQLLEINLWDCQLTEECFAPNSLTNFRRPVKFDWQFNDSAYLKEEIFKPFLDADQRNEVVVTEDYFEPDDERNQWNQNDENYKNRVILECRP